MAKRGRPRTDKQAKRKAVKVRLCDRMHAGNVVEPYRIMEEIIGMDRQELKDLNIGIAWHTGWRPDADGVRTHGKCQKRSELDRSLDTYDVIIILNEKSWLAFSAQEKRRLICHELEHIQISCDKNGEPLIDDKGRQVIRMRRHDVGDFASIIGKFGLPPCLTNVQIADADRPLLKLAEEKAQAAAPTDPPAEDEPVNERIEIRGKGMKLASVVAMVQYRPGEGWRFEYAAQLGNYEASDAGGQSVTRGDCLASLQEELLGWLADIKFTGTADQKRAMARRRDMMREQVEDYFKPLLGTSGTIPFAEDPNPSGMEDAEPSDGQ